MTRQRLYISSFQEWTGAALNQFIQGLIDHVDIGSVSTEQLLEQLKATLQLSQSGATAWYEGANLDCAISYNFLLHQRDQALRGVSPLVPLEEWEHLRTAPFGASSLFDKLTTKLHLRDKVASQQRDYTLYRGSATFTVDKTRAAPYRSAPARSVHLRRLLWQYHCRSHVNSPFWPLKDVVQDVPFTNEEDDDTGQDYPRTRTPVSPIVTRLSTLDPLDIP